MPGRTTRTGCPDGLLLLGGRGLRRRLGSRRSGAAALAGALPFAGAAAAGAAPGSATASVILVPDATVATTKSRCTVGVQPSTPVRLCQRTLSLMSSPVRSASKCAGTFSGSHSTSIAWRTTFSTPPRFSPGLASSLAKRTVTATRICSPAASRWKSTCSGTSVTGWNCTSRISARCALPSTDTSYSRDRQPPAVSSRVTTLGSSAIRVGASLAP